MLASYQQQVQRLLNDEANQFFNIADLTTYINLGRNDIARQTECLIANATLTTTPAIQTYVVGSLTPPGGSGLLSPINVRNLRTIVAGLSNRLEARPWQWFSNYYLSGQNSVSTGLNPTLWAQQTQGISGTIYLWPIPNGTASIIVEATWTPIALIDDTTIEALPYPWTDCVPYFAAYAALIQAQRGQDAQAMMKLYDTFLQSSRLAVTPQWLPGNFPTLKPLQSPVDQSLTMAGQGKPAQRGEGAL